jgi:hypothetical protein
MDAERALLSSLDPLYEVEEDEDRDLEEEASIKYDTLSVLNSIGNDDFKSVYMALMPHIYEQSLNMQRVFCRELLSKIEKIYYYVFPMNLDFDNEDQVSDLYKFVEFLSFDHFSFLGELWKLLPVNLRTLDIASYCDLNSDLVMSKVEEVVRNQVFSRLVLTFVGTYTKENMIKFIVENTIKSRMLVFLKTQEGEEDESRRI